MKFTDLKTQEDISKIEGATGVSVHYFFSALDDCFHKTSYIQFQKFFKRNAEYRKWMIFSDYVLGDENKSNDVLVFSIMPYRYDFDEFGEYIKIVSKKDFKKSKSVRNEFIEMIKTQEIFNMVFVLNKDRKLHSSDEKQYLIAKYEFLLKSITNFMKEEPDNPNHPLFASMIDSVLTTLKRKSVNISLLRNIEIVSTIVPYIASQIYANSFNSEIIGWFSDRDKLLTYKKSDFRKDSGYLIHQLANANFTAFVDQIYPIILTKPKFVLGVPEESGTMFYDSYNRIPDLIAGVMADYNYFENQSSLKSISTIENILVDEKTVIYKLNFDENTYSSSVLVFSRTE